MKVAVRRLVLAAAPVLMLGAAGCSIHEQTQRWYSADNGINAEAGDIGLRNVQVVSDGDGTATVIATLTNRGDNDDELAEVRIGDVTADIADGPLELPVSGVADLGPDADRVDGFDVDAVPGYTVSVEFRFENAPRTTVQALVRPAEGAYAEALPAEPAPGTEEPTDGPTETPGDQPTEEPTSTATP
ncbi:hypothetical protein [Jiangella alba]|uniref:Copper(I)-binding protein n=1 Tax=Jiangella alba TaxID=561176 RepID=A0A1H5PRA4_9ACTN|nr:hypothetical protein [Jiangella alba]SEF16275.1 hypothetical protein SAMN04488561_5315 [Jiangella alba]